MGSKEKIEPIIRIYKEEDLESIVDIDMKVLGEEREEFWESKVVGREGGFLGLVAEYNEKVIGFMFGETAGNFLGKSGKEIHAMLQEEAGEEAIIEPIEQVYLGKSFDFVGRITRNAQSNRLEWQIKSWHPIEYSKEIDSLLDELGVS